MTEVIVEEVFPAEIRARLAKIEAEYPGVLEVWADPDVCKCCRENGYAERYGWDNAHMMSRYEALKWLVGEDV